MNKIIYLDIDDTLADTSSVLTGLLNRPIKLNKFLVKDLQHIVTYYRMAKSIYHDHDFWRKLPLKSEAQDIYQYSKHITSSVKILSALPTFYKRNSTSFIDAAKAKIDWVNLHFNEISKDDIIVSYSKEKYLHVKNDGNLHILIDDKLSNVIAWKKAGGLAIHCVDSKKVIEQLKFIHQFKDDNLTLLNTFNNIYNEKL